jgi:hypothetical protein
MSQNFRPEGPFLSEEETEAAMLKHLCASCKADLERGYVQVNWQSSGEDTEDLDDFFPIKSPFDTQCGAEWETVTEEDYQKYYKDGGPYLDDLPIGLSKGLWTFPKTQFTTETVLETEAVVKRLGVRTKQPCTFCGVPALYSIRLLNENFSEDRRRSRYLPLDYYCMDCAPTFREKK